MSKYPVRLTSAQRRAVAALLRRRDLKAYVHARARALLCADQGHTHAYVVSASGLGIGAVRHLRLRFVTRGLDAALHTTSRPNSRIELTHAERNRLKHLARQAPDPTRVPQRARLLLEIDQGETDTALAHRFHVGSSTLTDLRRRFAQGGIEGALHARGMKRSLKQLTDQRRRRLLALARSPAPPGQEHWTLRRLAQEAIRRGIVDYVSYETIRKILKNGG